MIENINLLELDKNKDLNSRFLTAKIEGINESCAFYKGNFFLDSYNYYPITEDFKSFDELFVRIDKNSRAFLLFNIPKITLGRMLLSLRYLLSF